MDELDFTDIDADMEGDFPRMWTDYQLRQFRKEIYVLLISRKDYSEYANVERVREDILEKVRGELHEIGWTTALSYGDTGLFIYKGEKPKNCW